MAKSHHQLDNLLQYLLRVLFVRNGLVKELLSGCLDQPQSPSKELSGLLISAELTLVKLHVLQHLQVRVLLSQTAVVGQHFFLAVSLILLPLHVNLQNLVLQLGEFLLALLQVLYFTII